MDVRADGYTEIPLHVPQTIVPFGAAAKKEMVGWSYGRKGGSQSGGTGNSMVNEGWGLWMFLKGQV